MTSVELTCVDWLNSKTTPYIIVAKAINDGRKIENCKKKASRTTFLRKAPEKLYVRNATTGKPTTKKRMFVIGDFARPFGTLPLALFCLTEESAKIFAKCDTTFKFNAISLTLQELQQLL